MSIVCQTIHLLRRCVNAMEQKLKHFHTQLNPRGNNPAINNEHLRCSNI
jgi:hypothetical protein